MYPPKKDRQNIHRFYQLESLVYHIQNGSKSLNDLCLKHCDISKAVHHFLIIIPYTVVVSTIQSFILMIHGYNVDKNGKYA